MSIFVDIGSDDQRFSRGTFYRVASRGNEWLEIFDDTARRSWRHKGRS